MKAILLVITTFIFFGCARQQESDPSILLETDNAFSQMSVDKGLNAAFIYFAGDSVVKMREGKFPIVGKEEMARIYLARPDSAMTLQWKPVKAEISQSNDLGYTFGIWELYLKDQDTTLYGNYLSIWKKQANGTWKYVVDAGVNTPKPR
jgi:ketosteroid isomerase-like protein